MQKKIEDFQRRFKAVQSEVQKIVVGNHEVIFEVLVALFAGGNVLLEGVPGLGKTMLIKTLSEVLNLDFSRIQFTPDLMPADIVGTNIINEDERGKRAFVFQKGPVFTQMLLADEINRATPKTQSALLEAMQEHTVTSSNQRFVLKEPFFVMATQNPIEQEGTYPLPEAQLDRFFFKCLVPFPTLDELITVVDRTTGVNMPTVQKIMSEKDILEARELVRSVPVASEVKNYAGKLVLATHPGISTSIKEVREQVKYGSSPRGMQGLILSGKVRALVSGNYQVSVEDIRSSVKPVLRHRVALNFQGEAEGMTPDKLLDLILAKVLFEAKQLAA
ncbi:MoxR family ATPase [bacterium]|nr:MoxR family ATPase [bacterium]